jgi:tetratricopeptide (TPR) repeat protein
MLAIAQRHDDWSEVNSALRKLAIFRKGFPFDAARTILGEPRPLSLLKTWGMVTSQNGRWEIDPLLLRVVEPDSSTQQIQYQFYRALVADLAAKQDYTRLIAELDNIEIAFNHAMSINDLPGAFEIAQNCSEFMGTWARFEQRRAWLDRIASCLQENTRDTLYADVQIALGVAYQERPGTDRRLNLQRSVTCFERALRRYTAARAPHQYALIQNNLGITYRILAETDHPTENLHLSIHAFNQAAKYFGPKLAPVQFAAVQNNMGAAYIQLAGVKDRADNLWRAVAALRRAAPYLTPTSHPMQYAEIMHNLGTAFGELADVSDRKDNLERAIRHYGRALQILTPQTAPMDYARTYYNLGLAYRGYAELERPDQHLENAIRAFDQALRFWSMKTAPQTYAAAQMMLGQTWLDYAELEYQQSHLEKAAAAFNEALDFYSIRNNPGEYVKALIMLGIVLRRMGKTADALVCWQKAEKYFRSIGMTDVADQMKGWMDAPPRHSALFGKERDRPSV